jgi:acetyl-CoA synthetase
MSESGRIGEWSHGELLSNTNRVSNGLRDAGLNPGDAVAVCLPMNADSIAIYLGIIRARCVAVSIPDSFSGEEIRLRLKLATACMVFTQDALLRGGKRLPLYQRVAEAAEEASVVVLRAGDEQHPQHRRGDKSFAQFLPENDHFESVACAPADHSNILFSSGTTGEPKAIPWNHTTPIKCASDACLHHDVRPGDVLAWPTNLGWMMGPWLIYSALVNQATVAVYDGAPTGSDFGTFVEKTGVTMLGVIPSLVRTWRQSSCMEGKDWSRIRAFSSTGECSNPDDMRYLMTLAGNKPVIEYCGGTEIGGGYLASTMLHPCIPSTFSTPTLGLDVQILDENGHPGNVGELFVEPPSIGMSVELINRDHSETYYGNVPRGPRGQVLRRHGDRVERLPNGYFRVHGRADDAMNLGGIKVSSAEIERAAATCSRVREAAAIAVAPPGGGPSRLVVYVVLTSDPAPQDQLHAAVQHAISTRLNPLFKLHAVIPIDGLPRTASNKVMRRILRADYEARQTA